MSGRGYRKTRPNPKPVTGAAAATPPSPRFSRATSSRSFNAGERSASAFPTLPESLGTLSIDTSKEIVRSQSVCQRNSRRGLCSAVPDSAVLSPVSRPDEGGSEGRQIMVYTNHFRVEIGDAVIYQYDIDIVLIDRNHQSRPALKEDRWNVIQLIGKKVEDFPVVWYDEGKTLYTREILPELSLPLQFQLGKGEEMKNFQLNKMALVRQDRVQSIHDFMRKKTNIRPREMIRIIEVLFKQRTHKDYVCVRNQYYDRRRQLDNLGDGRGMAKGFYQALFLTRNGPTLNINLTFTCFYMPLQFIDFASQYLRKDITKNFTDRDAKTFGKILRNLQVETMHTGRKIFYRFREFGRPANQLMFPCHRDDASADATSLEQTSVANYFHEKYGRKLLFPHLPCINTGKGKQNQPIYLPMELVRIVEWQRALKPLDKTQRGAVSRNTIIKPQQRYKEIMNIINTNMYDRDPYLKELDIRVDGKEMLQLQARVLPTPAIRYRRRGQGEILEQVSGGKWRIRNWFYNTTPINSWGMIYFGDKPDRDTLNTLQDFRNGLPALLRKNGFIINAELSLTVETTDEYQIKESLLQASKKGWQLAIVILNTKNSDTVYNQVKNTAHRSIGLMTQCVNYQVLYRNMNKLEMYVENISQKINGKLGGINGVVNLKTALRQSSEEDLFMFFGADVTHSTSSTDRPSIAAVVGSRDLTNTLYSARLCEQYPKKGRCSIEIIKELDTMVADLLRVFAHSCGNRLPNKLIFYRDGVDEGQYQKVLDHEVTKIKHACRAIYGNKSLPQLTFIVVKKRHQTRFFLYEKEETLNVQAGTVIDQGITHPSQFDFYLCSQAAIMGTSQPALYHVLHDDNDFSSNDIQQLTYWLCHTDMRCTKSVSIPAPVHYAHLAAYGSRALKFGEENDHDSVENDNEEPQSYSLDDIKTKLMILDDKVADDMWFL